ncbi:bifunctional metallophosphatase/5'-nucleotidase [Athalassotoga sp.]|uniref:bifunctional metallophosphatase/5'-nucleotidase n=1 Tax=Athalassotoga sp. TaxID=2022597 RepID=UPI0017759171|nr:bifunctional metallophosphatase/5'-nucleotidase [Mesoaciditoga lauensis]
MKNSKKKIPLNTHEVLNLTIITTTDVHGYIFPIDYTTKRPVNYGLARIAPLIEKIRKENKHVLYFDGGDTIQGSPLEYYNGIIGNEIDPTIDAMNYLKCDAMTIGNHDFNFGRKVLDRAIAQANFPFTSANIVKKDTKDPFFGKGYAIYDIEDGPRVAYLALTTKLIPFWEEQEYISDLDFLDPVDVAREYIPMLKKMADLVIVGYHGGFERDPQSGEIISELNGENQGYEMATTLEGVSAYIFGHQHRTFSTKVKEVPVVMASSHGKALGRIDLKLSFDGKWNVESSEVQIIDPSERSDKELLHRERPFQITVQKWLDEIIGESLGDFYIEDVMYGRTHETALVNLINDVQLYYSGAEISATSIFSPEVHGWKKGMIRRRDVMGVYIFSNTLKVFELTGLEIRDMIEHSASYFALCDKEIVASGDLAGYKYLIFKGISYTIDLTKPSGSRILRLEKDGKKLEDNKKYTIAVNSYQAGGNGGYTMFIGKKPVKEIKTQIVELIIDYIKMKHTIEPRIENYWAVIF